MDDRFVDMKSNFRGAIRKFFRPRLPGPRDYSWFDHPEMQARIAKAEADLREGRFVDLHSEEEIFAYFDSLKPR